MIQVPRLYEMHKKSGKVRNFGDLLRNFFEPLFRVTLDPASLPNLNAFLTLVSGVDLVDDESLMVPPPDHGLADTPPPDLWTADTNPPFLYWCYYFSINLAVLNQLRGERGFTQLSFRPHCGEAGNPDHLVAAFLTAESINHGINLKAVPALQYLYYLAQVGLAMSPVSNGRLFLEIEKNPFGRFFELGMNVSLSTDDPLMLHFTRNPLLEEYAVASQVYRLDSVDLAELARNSVLQSGFEYPFKARWLGEDFAQPGPDGTRIEQTNLPYVRLQFRLEVLREELQLLGVGVAEGKQPLKEELVQGAAGKSVRITRGP
jgi:AMP deaminase